MVWHKDDPMGRESEKIKYEIVPYTRGKVLELGPGPWKLYPHFTSIDNNSGWEEYEFRGDIVGDCADLSIFTDCSWDSIFSSHLLEHIEDYKAALAEWWRVIKPGGHLVLYVPHADLYPRMGEEDSNPDHKHDFKPRDIVKAMKGVGSWDLVVSQTRDKRNEYSFLQVYRKASNNNVSKYLYSYQAPKPHKRAAVVRYGGFGDMIQASSVFPGLKKQGYHITMYTTPAGHEIIKDDPHVDEWFIQDTDQVPQQELWKFWIIQSKQFKKWINFSQSVEVSFLFVKEQPQFYWNKKTRNTLCDFNYLEIAHSIADVPLPPRQKFYPTEIEKKWAHEQRERLDCESVLMWVLSGSSVHKSWPYMDNALARIMVTIPGMKVVLVGDEICTILEVGWEKEPRVVLRSNKWTIRQTLAFAQVCDAVTGPETGVLNAMGQEPDVGKLLFLSHSTARNISEHWVNTVNLEAKGCECWPCHKLHGSGFTTCTRDEETGAALCQARISLEDFMDGLNGLLRTHRRKAA